MKKTLFLCCQIVNWHYGWHSQFSLSSSLSLSLSLGLCLSKPLQFFGAKPPGLDLSNPAYYSVAAVALHFTRCCPVHFFLLLLRLSLFYPVDFTPLPLPVKNWSSHPEENLTVSSCDSPRLYFLSCSRALTQIQPHQSELPSGLKFLKHERSIRLGLSDMKFSLKWCLRQASLHSSCFQSRFWVISSGVLRLVWGDKMLPGTLTGSVMFGSFCSKGRTRFVLFLLDRKSVV